MGELSPSPTRLLLTPFLVPLLFLEIGNLLFITLMQIDANSAPAFSLSCLTSLQWRPLLLSLYLFCLVSKRPQRLTFRIKTRHIQSLKFPSASFNKLFCTNHASL